MKRPSTQSTHMLKPMWMNPKCRNPLVNRRHGSEGTSGPNSPPSRIRVAEPLRRATGPSSSTPSSSTATLRPMSTWVAMGRVWRDWTPR